MIKIYEVKFKMEATDDWHVVTRPFSDNIGDLRSFMAEELRVPKSYIKSIKLIKDTKSIRIGTYTLGNLLYKRKKTNE